MIPALEICREPVPVQDNSCWPIWFRRLRISNTSLVGAAQAWAGLACGKWKPLLRRLRAEMRACSDSAASVASSRPPLNPVHHFPCDMANCLSETGSTRKIFTVDISAPWGLHIYTSQHYGHLQPRLVFDNDMSGLLAPWKEWSTHPAKLRICGGHIWYHLPCSKTYSSETIHLDLYLRTRQVISSRSSFRPYGIPWWQSGMRTTTHPSVQAQPYI
jgi:hypothetical protein